jgi:O-antigen/teichoic acid export membrane protein
VSPPRSDKVFALAATGARSLGRLALAAGVARALGAEAFGTYALLLVLETVVTTLVACRAAAPLTTIAPGLSPIEAERLYGWALARQGADLRRGGALSLLLAPLALLALPAAVVGGYGLSLIFTCAARAPRGWRLATFGAQRVFWGELLAVVPAFAALLVGASLGGLYLALALGGALALGVLWAPSSAALSAHVEAERMGSAMLWGSLGYAACSRVQPFVLGAVHGLVQVANFAGALTLLGPLRVLSAAVDVVLRPRLARVRAEPRAARLLLRTALGLQLAGGVIAGICMALLSERLSEWVFGASLTGVAQLGLLATVYVTLEAVGSTLVVGLQVSRGAAGAQQATRLRLGLSVASLVAVVPACAFGGAAGALAALAVGELVFAGAAACALAKSSPRRVGGPGQLLRELGGIDAFGAAQADDAGQEGLGGLAPQILKLRGWVPPLPLASASDEGRP